MAACTLLASLITTTASPQTTSPFTPNAGDLLVAFVHGTGTSETVVFFDSTGNDAKWDRVAIINHTTAGNNGRGSLWVQRSLATNVSTTCTSSSPTDPGDFTGNAILVYGVSGMTLTGTMAVRQFAQDQAQAAGTPQIATLAQNTLPSNPVLAFVMDEGAATGWVPPSGFTEPSSPAGEGNFATPTYRAETCFVDGGLEQNTFTWGNASTGVYASIVAELDTGTGTPLSPLFHTITGGY